MITRITETENAMNKSRHVTCATPKYNFHQNKYTK
jgi:hypothetical protein